MTEGRNKEKRKFLNEISTSKDKRRISNNYSNIQNDYYKISKKGSLGKSAILPFKNTPGSK